jgi:hypothetical protein
MDDAKTYSLLAFAGAIPFVACALLPFSGTDSIPLFGALDEIAGIYGLAIISFLAGTHWAFQLLRPRSTPFNLFLGSNVTFLVVWFSWFILPVPWALALQSAAFVFLLFVDQALSGVAITPRAYLRARSIATVAAILSLLVIAVSHQ